MIGIVGGVGPRAGLDVFQKILEETPAKKDQEHYPVLLHSLPGNIPDRTGFLMGTEKENPGHALTEILLALEKAGATVAGIPCNTAHSREILSVVENKLLEHHSKLKLLNMIDEVANLVVERFPSEAIGVLSTKGTRFSGVYRNIFLEKQIALIEPDDDWQELVHQAAYDEDYGIKANSSPVSARARNDLQQAIAHLKEKGAAAVILGCTELPLAFPEDNYLGLPLIDANRVLAKSLIKNHLQLESQLK